MLTIKDDKIDIHNLKVNYKTIENGETRIILLHGWGITSNKYIETIKAIYEQCPNFKILIPDFPGFGKSDDPKENWDLDDYAIFLDDFIKNTTRQSRKRSFGIKKVILIGHSFGGRVAIKYTARHPEKVEKLILTGAAGIKHSLTIKQKLIFIAVKVGKIFFSVLPLKAVEKYFRHLFYKILKEKDYYKASPKMRKIMKNILAEDLTLILEKIYVPTLLLWGKDDKTTNLSDGRIMKENIKDSELIIIENANHSLPYQKPKEFAKFVLKFIKNK